MYRATLVFSIALGLDFSLPALPVTETGGRWEGTVAVPGREFPLIIDLSREAGGHWVGSAIVPGFGVKGSPLAELEVQGPVIAFTIKGVLGNPKLTGQISPQGEFTGNFTQGGHAAPFVLHRSGPPQVDAPRVSTSVRKEMEGTWEGEMILTTYPVKVVLELSNPSSEKAAAKLVITGKRVTNLPVDLVIQENDTLQLIAMEAAISYEASFRPDSYEISGTFIQGPLEVPLTLRRSTGQ